MSKLLDIYLNSSQIGWMDAECATYIHISFDAESAYLTDAVPLCEQVQLCQLRDAPEEKSAMICGLYSRESFSSHASLHDVSISVTGGSLEVREKLLPLGRFDA